MSEAKPSRRDFVRTAAAGVVGFGLGAGVGYGASQMMAPPPRVAPAATVTVTQTAPATPAKGVPKEPIKLAVLSWFTGVPAMIGETCLNAANMTVDVINKGGGILGRKIEVLKRDIGAPDVTVEAYRRAVLEDKVDLVFGDTGGSNANALVPVIEQLKIPWFFQCSTTLKEVEELDPNPLYVFRTGEQNLAEPLVAAQLILRYLPNAKRVAGINPDYVYGREAYGFAKQALNVLAPHIESVYEAWPPQFATDYSSHIAAVLAAKPDVVLSCCWGGELVTLCKQGAALGLFKQTKFLSYAYVQSINALSKDFVPEGMLCLGRDYYPLFPPHNLFPLNKWFVEEYYKRYQKYPEFDAHQVFSGIFAYKQAIERLYDWNKSYPENNEICRAIQNSQVIGPGGHRVITSDGQFINAVPFGITKYDPKYPWPIFDPLASGFIQPEYVYNPKSIPPILQYPLGTGMKYSDWFKTW